MTMSKTLQCVYEGLKETFSEPDARYVLKQIGYGWTEMITRPGKMISADDLTQIETITQRYKIGEPLSRIFGVQDFWGRVFSICLNSLDPRIDTEVLVERAVELYRQIPPARILDLGTGSGCILISLLSEFPDAFGIGGDLSRSALLTAQKNAEQHNITERCHFFCGDWEAPIHGRFDLIVSNPPYIRSDIISELEDSVKNHDPILALDGGKDGLDSYKRIFSRLNSLLSAAGTALFEIGYDQEDDIMRLAIDYGLRVSSVHRDSVGLPRVVEISNGDK